MRLLRRLSCKGTACAWLIRSTLSWAYTSNPKIDLNEAASACEDFRDYIAAVTANELATFSIEVDGEQGKPLAIKAWNALWHFHLLSLACRTPCFPLLTTTDANGRTFKSANRNLVLARPAVPTATREQAAWARDHFLKFNRLISDPVFSTAMRCYGNAHHLIDLDTRIMLLWAGIEGLLSVDGELNRRLALYASLMRIGTPSEKAAYFAYIKKAYGLRSKVVHGGSIGAAKLQAGYDDASEILASLLARCVELGRIPSPQELDALAASQTVQ
jgi:hypothetical protein